MQAVEFEADIVDNIIEIPARYGNLSAKHVKVIVLVDEKQETACLDFSDFRVSSFAELDAVSYQREVRDEW